MTQETNQTAGKKPPFLAYIVPERDGASWIPVGAAWTHKDGDGFNIRLDITIRPDTRLVLRKADARPPSDAETVAEG